MADCKVILYDLRTTNMRWTEDILFVAAISRCFRIKIRRNLTQAVSNLLALSRAILRPTFPRTRAAARTRKCANVSSLLARSLFRKILVWPICHSASVKLSLLDKTFTKWPMPSPFFASSVERRRWNLRWKLSCSSRRA